jgi:muramoyltetrapeptide carboxypeptidase
VPPLRKARALRPGATIGIAAPAGPVDPDLVDAGAEMLRKLGFEPLLRAGVKARCGYLAGDDERRAAELTELILDPDVAGIVCARGGYGCHRIISRLDAKAFRKAAKPLVGYSDITTLLLWQRQCAGLMGIHGPMLDLGDELAPEAAQSLVRALLGSGPLPRLAGQTLVDGWADGRTVGGSLNLCVASLGTPWELDTRDAILMLEDVSEPPYRVDRMLQQLKAAGKLEAAAAIGVGAMVDCEHERYPEPTVDEVLEEILTPLGIPVLTHLPFGHCRVNFAWPHGARAAVDGARGEIELLEFAVGR